MLRIVACGWRCSCGRGRLESKGLGHRTSVKRLACAPSKTLLPCFSRLQNSVTGWARLKWTASLSGPGACPNSARRTGVLRPCAEEATILNPHKTSYFLSWEVTSDTRSGVQNSVVGRTNRPTGQSPWNHPDKNVTCVGIQLHDASQSSHHNVKSNVGCCAHSW